MAKAIRKKDAPKKVASKKAAVKKPPKAKSVKQTAEEKRRREWEINNELISEAFFKSILENKKFPTYESIAQKLKINERTVRRHLQENEMFEDLKLKLRALKNKALLTLAVKAIKGESHHWTRLFFEVTDDVKKEDKTITININGKKVGSNQIGISKE